MIVVRELSRKFPTERGEIEVLRKVSFDIEAAERIAVVGASGAGKTTLMHLLGGLDRPSGGSVTFHGQDIFRFGSAELDTFRNRTIGFVFQFHQLLPEFSALENVMLPVLVSRGARAEARQRAERLLASVGLDHRVSHKPGQLSGGEQQRVAIARALVMSPRLLLADEPTGNLDSATSDEILALLDQLHEQHQLTMVIVTHSSQVAQRMDRTLHMVDGQLAGLADNG
ncbi:MAG: lipoprotein-releasing system ATP-binding protein LolD [Desulfuromonas sp.]|nr:MAG: lipoprotein-releasing system ATP-binding protein LolD [Desulfuromonas sp.]